MRSSLKKQALKYLRKCIDNPDAEFRDGQWETITAVTERNARVLVVQRTGWGKSWVYFIATKILRKRGRGPTLLISPLLSLIRNQIEAASKAGLKADSINSTNKDRWPEVEEKLLAGELDLLLISPERLANSNFRENSLLPVINSVGLFVVDEAHCISDWGHDFRPDYLRILRIIRLLPPNCPVLCTTATANDRVVEDIKNQIGENLEISRGPLVRSSLQLQNLHLPSQAERMAWLADKIPGINGSGIIYVLTKKDADRVAEWLRQNDIDAWAYHSDMDDDEKTNLEIKLINNKVKTLVATVALGMGFDKPDLSYVIHFQRPGSVVFYYQQVGRAGRAIDHAYGVLLSGDEDADINDYFIRNAFPPDYHVEQILKQLESASDGLSVNELMKALNLRWSDINKVFNILSVRSPSPVQKIKSKWFRTPVQYSSDTDKVNKIISQRKKEQTRMLDYIHTDGCLMEFLAKELDDPHTGQCGNCGNCREKSVLGEGYPENLVLKAVEFLKRSNIPVEPRIMWPSGGIADGSLKGRIPVELRPEPGRALCYWGDAGWGNMVRDGKHSGYFSDLLLDGTVEMIRNRWIPAPFPTWISCVPSLANPELVTDFAKRLAGRLGLPFHNCIVKTKNTEPQKSMQNSHQQAENVFGSFALRTPPPEFSGPVLLIDDIIDSKWTMTFLSVLLRENGSGKVYPVALANASGAPSYAEKVNQ